MKNRSRPIQSLRLTVKYYESEGKDEHIDDPCREMKRLARSFLDLKRWGFKESFRKHEPSLNAGAELIYNSEWCRVSFGWGGQEMHGGYTISIYYGRLHAPSTEIYMLWNSKLCRCWHDIGHALNFLDDLSPREAVERSNQWPRVMEQFRQSEVGQSLKGRRSQPEWLARMHAAVWEHYGLRLFELFDMRHPNLWEEYQQFIREFYDIKGRSPNIKPSLDSIC